MSPIILGLWSVELKPGQTLSQKTTPAIQITNIAYGAEIKGDKRSVISMKYPEFEQQDSDDEDESDDDEAPELEVVKGKSPKASKTSEDDEDDEDSIVLPPIITKDVVLASLTPGRVEQTTVNISLVEDVEVVEFSVSGENSVHLLGHYIQQEDFDQPPSDEDDFSDFDEDEDIDSDMVGMDFDESMMEDDSRFQELEEPVSKKRSAEEPETKNAKKKNAKKQKAESGEAIEPKVEQKAEKKEKAEKKKEDKKDNKKDDNKPKSVTLAGGLVITDAKIGTGAEAKAGKKVSMRYIGKLDNGKVFDSNTKGSPFNFGLGKGEVIKGWDQGIVGMKVGGERKLRIPAALAYGKRGAPPDIPGNATLNFEVKLLNVK